jgi:hypothetical protein
LTTGRRNAASSVEAPRREIAPWKTGPWVVAVSLVALAAALLLGCSPSPSPKETPHPPTTCAWPAESCCNQPQGLGVVTLRELRAQRWER